MVAIIVAIIGGIGSLFGIVIKGIFDLKNERQKAEENRKTEYTEIMTRLDNIERNTTESIQKIQANLEQLRADLIELKEESRDNDDKMKKALMNIARTTINKDYKYFINLGRIDDNSYQSIVWVYESYKELGGNTFIDEEMEKLRNLPRILTK